MRNLKLIFILIALFYLNLLHSNSFKALLDSAFTHYKNGNFSKSLKIYKQIEDSGYTSAYMYYNMGNAYFRLNQIAKAILYYERALLLEPNDADIQHNLKYANTFVSDKINELPEPFYITWYKAFTQIFSANTWAWFSIALFLVILTLIYLNFLTVSTFVSKLIKFITTVLFILWIVSISATYYSYNRLTAHSYAIIMDDTVEIKSSPDDNSTSLFVLHEGTKVYIKETFEDWAEIRISDGNTGWIKIKSIERI